MSFMRSWSGKSHTVWHSANVLLLEHHTPPNRCDVIRYSTMLSFSSHKKRNAFRAYHGIQTCKYITSMSPITANLNCLNRRRRLISLFVRSGPCRHWLFKLTSWYLAAQSNTTRIFPGFDWLVTWWWGRYQIEPSFNKISESGTRSA